MYCALHPHRHRGARTSSQGLHLGGVCDTLKDGVMSVRSVANFVDGFLWRDQEIRFFVKNTFLQEGSNLVAAVQEIVLPGVGSCSSWVEHSVQHWGGTSISATISPILCSVATHSSADKNPSSTRNPSSWNFWSCSGFRRAMRMRVGSQAALGAVPNAWVHLPSESRINPF